MGKARRLHSTAITPRDITTAEQLATVRASVRELYRRMTGPVIRSFYPGINHDDATIARAADPVIGAQRVASAIARHLRMPDLRLVVGFVALGDTGHAAEVELGPGPTYYITADTKYRNQPVDLGAVLAHEVMHVFLHRHEIRFDDPLDNEILTDAATAYLGVGRPMLEAQRTTTTTSGDLVQMSWQRLGYLTPEMFGYLLAMREWAIEDDISAGLSDNARQLYLAGRERVLADYRRPPLRRAGALARLKYRSDRDKTRAGEGYRFDGDRVVFTCPTCHQRLRAPLREDVTLRCGTCARTVAVRT